MAKSASWPLDYKAHLLTHGNDLGVGGSVLPIEHTILQLLEHLRCHFLCKTLHIQLISKDTPYTSFPLYWGTFYVLAQNRW